MNGRDEYNTCFVGRLCPNLHSYRDPTVSWTGSVPPWKRQLHLLEARFRSAADLAAAAGIEAEIRGRCAELEASVSDLSIRLESAAAEYSSCLEATSSALCGVRGGIGALRASTSEIGISSKLSADVLRLSAY
jgi:hypothetical protein